MTDIVRKKGMTGYPGDMSSARAVEDPDTQRLMAQVQTWIQALQADVAMLKARQSEVVEEVVAPEEPHVPELPVIKPAAVSRDEWVMAPTFAELKTKITGMNLQPPRHGYVTGGTDRGMCYVLGYLVEGGATRVWRPVTVRTYSAFPAIVADMALTMIHCKGCLWSAKAGDTKWTLNATVFNNATGVPGT